MQITVTIEGKSHVGEETGTRLKVAGTSCPKCSNCSALVDSLGVIVAIYRSQDQLSAAIKGATADGRCGPFEVQYPDREAPLFVRAPRPVENERGWTGDAECCRCRQVVGTFKVEMNSLFGREEDDRVLRGGRARVY